MKNFDVSKFDELKTRAENFYKTIGKIYCPYFREEVVFNAKGLEHLKFQTKNHARPIIDQQIRLRLIHLAPEVIKLSRTIQGILHLKNFERVRSNNRNELVLKDVRYYEFVAILVDGHDNKRVRVVIKQVDGGPKYFWSIIPFWKMDKKNRKRRMNIAGLDID